MGRLNPDTLVSIESARSLGLKRYFTGLPCKRGHISERSTSNKTCMACHDERQARLYSENSERICERVSRYSAANKSKVAERSKRYQQRNRERLCRYYSRRYYKNREKIAAKVRAYRKDRPGFSNECGKAYLLRKSRAMPSWVDRQELRSIYAEASRLTLETGIVHSVDHIYPLKGKNFSGLHVPWNLQIIPKVDNCRKGTKSPDEWRKVKLSE